MQILLQLIAVESIIVENVSNFMSSSKLKLNSSHCWQKSLKHVQQKFPGICLFYMMLWLIYSPAYSFAVQGRESLGPVIRHKKSLLHPAYGWFIVLRVIICYPTHQMVPEKPWMLKLLFHNYLFIKKIVNNRSDKSQLMKTVICSLLFCIFSKNHVNLHKYFVLH